MTNVFDPDGLGLDASERLARARADLRMGVPVSIEHVSEGQFDSDAVLFVPIETLSPARLAAMLAHFVDPVLVLSRRRAETLKMRVYGDDIACLKVAKDASLAWLQALADPTGDLDTPLKGPLTSLRGPYRDEYRSALQICKSARLLPAALCVSAKGEGGFAETCEVTRLEFPADIPLSVTQSPLRPVVSARLPLEVSQAGRLHVFRPDDGGEEHYAIEIGRPDRSAPVLARLHSACFTGDLLGSLKCDCGPQLRAALAQMGDEGSGVLLYLNQEGRGIGLANKMRAYALQDQGFDTVEANHRLGFEDDERDFRLGSDILKSLGFKAVRLLTNNPAKVAMMQASGIDVAERVELKVGENRFNRDYLATKAAKSGHIL